MVIIFASPLNYCKTVKEQFENLKSLELNALTEKEHRDIHHKFEQLALEDPDAFEEAFIASTRSTLNRARRLKVKEQLSEISEIVSMSYIAKHYFRKSRSWLSQRINEMSVNGKPVRFTPSNYFSINSWFKEWKILYTKTQNFDEISKE